LSQQKQTIWNIIAIFIIFFKELPKVKSVEQYEALLPWNIDAEVTTQRIYFKKVLDMLFV